MTLYELTGAWKWLYEYGDDPDMDPEIWFDTIEGLEGEIEAKADGYAMVRAALLAQADALKKEEQRLATRRKAIENNVSRMMERLQNMMQETGKTKFKTTLFSFGIQKNPASVVLDCAVEDLPEELIKRPEPQADKAAIKKIIEGGVPFPFAHLEQTESLRIR